MSQVQSSRRVPAIDRRSCIDRPTLSAPTEPCQNIFGPHHLSRFESQQSFLAQQAALAQDQYWQEYSTALQVLNGEALAQLSLQFLPSNSDPYATEKVPSCLYQPHQALLQGINSPISTSSPTSLASQESYQTISTESHHRIFDFEANASGGESVARPFPRLQEDNRYSTMVDRRMPSTPQSIEDDQNGIQQLIRYNAATPYGRQMDDGFLPGSGHATAYGSPASNHWYSEGYEDRPDLYQPRGDPMYGGYEWRGSPQPQYPQPHGVPMYPPQRFGSMIPPSPVVSDRSSGMMPAPRIQKAKAEPKRKVKAPKRTSLANREEALKANMHEPLSILTKDFEEPIRDMEAHVNRPVEERLAEQKNRGKIARPMNSFMCYRSAYAERTKKWCQESNHQKISKLSGISWRMETTEIRERYTRLAEIEKENHNKAFPGYKFSPAKAKTADRKRKGADSDDEDEGDDFDPADSDYDWTPSGARKRRSTPRRELGYHNSSQFIGGMPYPGSYHNLAPQVNRSAFHASNPGRPLPMPVEDLQAYGGPPRYYAHSIRHSPSQGGAQIEDVRIQHALPDHSAAPSGLPGANHDDLYGLEQNLDQGGMGFFEGGDNVDPTLMNFDQSYSGAFTEAGFNELDGGIIAQQSEEQAGQSQEQKGLVEEGKQPWDQPTTNPDEDTFGNWLGTLEGASK